MTAWPSVVPTVAVEVTVTEDKIVDVVVADVVVMIVIVSAGQLLPVVVVVVRVPEPEAPLLTVSDLHDLLPVLFGSPLYVASTVTAPAVAPVILVEQPPLTIEHVLELSVSEPVPDCDHVTLPVG